ncbi:suppressor for copper-sensitivity B [Pseudovibrio japonicus]|uniref:Suppressor for copper-sensitivity B n=1 Tax=Pseudovibrio japonicus TaxID=366534 RepID=A0ABQ3EQ67_9HYPH|nr:suppressor for copper-sensitivity B [Pseudovibrio japonicus]
MQFEWPAPVRFTAFGIENFGYEGEVVFPIQVKLDNPGEPVVLAAKMSVLVCSNICVPQTLDLSLALPKGSEIDRASGALIAKYAKKIPLEGDQAGVETARAFIDEDRTEFIVNLAATNRLKQPDVFPELGAGTALGKPDIRLSEADSRIWARFPILSFNEATFDVPSVTITDGPGRASTVQPDLVTTALAPPFSIDAIVPGVDEMVWIVALAFIGGLILNVMPCALPVLSIKLTSALKFNGQKSAAVRAGFLAAALGVMVFVWGLAITLFALQRMGVAVGWGLQFQNPIFLAVMTVVLIIFSANLFGAFEIMLPPSLQTWLSNKEAGQGYRADFFTGLFGAVLATPCSAPLLGTAIAFALAGRAIDIFVVFTSLGLGLAAPYLIVAAVPELVKFLPKPGRWMVFLKTLLGFMLSGTVLWLLWVLNSVAGFTVSLTVLTLAVALIAVLSLRRGPARLRFIGGGVLVSLVLAAPLALSQAPQVVQEEQSPLDWVEFDRSKIALLVSQGQVVFVDVTADWCLTCKANKVLVLDREPVRSALNTESVTAMRADWTRPDEKISRYLSGNNRFGIPFNAVYGPAAPDGIILPELLTTSEVMEAFAAAGGGRILEFPGS